MTDAEKREKVIAGLEAHANMETACATAKKEECPYYGYHDKDKMCSEKLAEDALAMLREQEPRVMTLEELRIDADESVVCWVEFASKSAVNVTAPHRGMAHICLPFLGTETITFVVERNYGEKWRCWTSRPTPEQMRDTPWEGDSDAD